MNAADPFGLVGQVLDGQFRVDQLVGEGGFSAVYRGHHQGLNEPIAVKCLKLPADLGTALVDSFVQRFRDESRILYRLSQGNLHVVRSIAAGTTQAPVTGALVPYMVLEWLEGRSMQSDFMIRRNNPLGEKGRSIDEIVKLFATAADGLAFAHSQGVAHRDLNPGNLFLANTQQGVKMKVLDFGVAKLMHDGALNMGPRSHTVGQIKIFAPAYGAPEQFDDRIGGVSTASDVYAFALILLEAMRDRSVVEGTNLTDFVAAATDPHRRPTPRSLGIEVPDEIEQTFARATTLDPAQRWQSAGDFWASFTIASKLATERKYEDAARETPPLAMGGPPPSAPKGPATFGKTPMARTMPLGADMPAMPRPAPGASRPRIPTTIGIPMPSSASVPRPPMGIGQTPLAPPVAPPRPNSTRPPGPTSSPRMPAIPHLPPAAGVPAIPRPKSDRPPAPAKAPGTARMQKVAQVADATESPSTAPPPPVRSMNDDDDEVDEATKVHAPAAEILQTLALHDAVAARNAAAQARAAEHASQRNDPGMQSGDEFDDVSSLANAARAGAFPLGDMHGGRRPPVTPIPPAPASGATMMMAPGGHSPAAAAQAMAAAAQAAHAAHAATPPPPSDPHAPGLDSTLAMMSPMVSPAYAQAQAQAAHALAAQAQGQATQGMVGVPVPYGQGSQLQQPQSQQSMQPQSLHHQQHGFTVPPAQQGQQGQQGHAFPPPVYAQPAPTGPKAGFPILPVGIGLGVLAVGGIILAVFALRGRHAPPTDPTALTDSASVTAVPVPVPVPEPVPVPAVIEPVPVATAEPEVAAEVDAAPAAAPSASASAAPSATAPSATAAPTTSPTTSAPGFAAGTAVPTVPTAAPKPSADPNAFNEGAARTRLAQANGVLVICHKEGGVTGAGSAMVTFASDGSVASVSMNPPYAGTKEGECAAKQFQRAKISAFTGDPRSVKHSFEVP